MKTFNIIVTDTDGDVYTHDTNYSKQDALKVAEFILASRDCSLIEVTDGEQNTIALFF